MSGSPDDALVRQWLESGDPRLAAWAAHAVLEDRRDALLPAVESTIERWITIVHAQPSLWDQDHWYGMTAMLDAVIQRDGELPAATLASMDVPNFPQAARIVLLLRLPWTEAEPVWTALYRPDSSEDFATTRVAAEMLASHPPEGFAADHLRRIKVSGRIVVIDDSGGGSGGSIGGASSCCGATQVRSRDWPEVGSYALQDSALQDSALHASAKVLLDRPVPVYLIREVNRQGHPGVCGGFSALTDAMRLELLGTMLGQDPAGMQTELTPQMLLRFRNRESYRVQVMAFVDDQKAKFDRVAAELAARGLLTDEERRGISLHLRLTLDDQRQKDAVDLPPILFAPPVAWASQ